MISKHDTVITFGDFSVAMIQSKIYCARKQITTVNCNWIMLQMIMFDVSFFLKETLVF